MIVTLTDRFIASGLGTLGVICLVLSRADGTIGITAYCLLGIAFAIAMLSVLRAVQLARVAREFKGGKPKWAK